MAFLEQTFDLRIRMKQHLTHDRIKQNKQDVTLMMPS